MLGLGTFHGWHARNPGQCLRAVEHGAYEIIRGETSVTDCKFLSMDSSEEEEW